MKTRYCIALILLLATVSQAQTASQWRGPERDGVYPGGGLLKEWPVGGPAKAWSASGIGKGYSSAVTDGKNVYVTGMKDSSDYVTALDMQGKILWQVPFGPSWNSSFPDTRCTPTVTNGMVYVLSGLGTISAINATTGKVRWSFDAAKKFGAAYGDWGVCESLLVTGRLVIYTPAGTQTSMVALDTMSGETVWKTESLNDTSAYVSPQLIQMGNKQIIVTLMANHLIGVDAADGKILWKYNYASLLPEESLKVWPGAPKTNTITPLFKDGNLYITGGYDHVGAMFTIAPDASAIRLNWTDTTLDCHHGGVVLHNGYLFGSNWLDNSRGNWCCVDWNTGKTMYEQKWQTKGSVITADNMLYFFDEKNGQLGLVSPDPSEFGLVSAFKVEEGKGPYWSHPSIYNGILYVRHGDVLMAYDIRVKP